MHTIRSSISTFFYTPLFKNCYRVKGRNFSTDHKLKVIYHNFSSTEAAEKFANHDSKRIFAPQKLPSMSPMASGEYPFKKVLLPFFGLHASILGAHYVGEYGTEHTGIKFDSKGKLTTYTYTIWHDISGSIGPQDYKDSDEGLRRYSGYTWDDNIVEEAMKGWEITPNLTPFDANEVISDTIVDSFLMHKRTAENLFKNTIYNFEKRRAENDISRRKPYSKTRIESLTFKYNSFKISGYLLPAYILQEVGKPPRIMPALNINNVTVFGPNQISIPKTMFVSLVLTGAIAIAAPQFAIAARVAGVVGAPLCTAVWAKYRLGFKNYWQEGKMINKRIDNNQETIESRSDNLRALATTIAPKLSIAAPETNPKLIEAPVEVVVESIPEVMKPYPLNLIKHIKLLGLKVNEPLTSEKINVAFDEVTRNFMGSNRDFITMTQDSLEAKRMLLSYVKKISSDVPKSRE